MNSEDRYRGNPIDRLHSAANSADSETGRIVKINEKLKSELMLVINQMETQLERVKNKRKERIEAEREAARLEGSKNREIRQGAKKKDQLRREIEQMWIDLESTFNNNAVTKMENDLKAEKLKLMSLF